MNCIVHLHTLIYIKSVHVDTANRDFVHTVAVTFSLVLDESIAPSSVITQKNCSKHEHHANRAYTLKACVHVML